MAPRLIRLPAMPTRSIIVTAKSIESGMAEATISPARRFPRKANRTAMTRTAPSNRFRSTVLKTWFDQVGPLVDDRRSSTPGGRAVLHVLHGLVEGHRHVAGVLAHPHEGEARGRPRPCRWRSTPPRRIAWPMADLGDVPDADRHAVAGRR